MNTIKKLRYLTALVMLCGLAACQSDEPEEMNDPIEIFQSISDISYTTAKLKAIILNANQEFTSHGFCWGFEKEPTVEDDKVETTGENFIAEISNLTPNMVYYVRPFVIQPDEIISYGEQSKFSTLSLATSTWNFSLAFGENGEYGTWDVEVVFYEDGTTWLEDPNFLGFDTAYGAWSIKDGKLTYHTGKVGENEEDIMYHLSGQFIKNSLSGEATADHIEHNITFTASPK